MRFAYFTDAGWPKPDAAKAKQLVKESGYDGSPIVLLDATETALHPQTLVVAQAMRDIGLNVEYQAMDWPTLSTRRANKNPIAQGGWSAFMSGPAAPDMFEPVGHLALRSNCEKAWFGWPCDEAIEKLRAEFTMIPDLEGRKAMRGRSSCGRSRPCPMSRSDSFIWSGATARISPDCSVRASRSTGASAAAGDRPHVMVPGVREGKTTHRIRRPPPASPAVRTLIEYGPATELCGRIPMAQELHCPQ